MERKTVSLDLDAWQRLKALGVERGGETLSDTIRWLVGQPPAPAEPRRADPPERRVVVDPEHDQRRQPHPDPGHASNNPRPAGDVSRAGAIARAVPGLMTGSELAKRQKSDI